MGRRAAGAPPRLDDSRGSRLAAGVGGGGAAITIPRLESKQLARSPVRQTAVRGVASALIRVLGANDDHPRISSAAPRGDLRRPRVYGFIRNNILSTTIDDDGLKKEGIEHANEETVVTTMMAVRAGRIESASSLASRQATTSLLSAPLITARPSYLRTEDCYFFIEYVPADCSPVPPVAEAACGVSWQLTAAARWLLLWNPTEIHCHPPNKQPLTGTPAA